MRFESVTCRAFGPFRNRTLSLKPGMNVIHGPNEAGKSTWRAAIAAGLCGRRRGRGANTKGEREFARKHRPWDEPGNWSVSVVIELAEGRQVELSHDFAGGVESSARNARYSNRDLSNEIMNDGAPDGSKWLGLDRRSFQSVACVRQSELLSILDDANALQADLQRAAATARTDATASDAVNRLCDFRRERVGTPHAPTKPLRSSERAVAAKHEALSEAKGKHASHRSLRIEVEPLEQQVRECGLQLAAARAVLADAAAAAANRRYAEAAELNDCFPDGAPRDSPEAGRLAERIARVLERWRTLADCRPPTGATTRELAEQIDALNAEENALLAARAERDQADAERRLEQARRLATRFPEGRPRASAEDQEILHRIATAIQKWQERPACTPPDGPTVVALEEELRETDFAMAQLASKGAVAEALRSIPPLGLMAFLAGAAGLAVGALFLWIAWIAFSGLLGVAGWWFRRALATQATVRSRQQAEKLGRRRRLEQAITARQLDDRQFEEEQKRLRQAAQEIRGAAAEAGFATDDLEAAVDALRELRTRRETDRREFVRRSEEWDTLQRLLGGHSLEELAYRAAELAREVKARSKVVSEAAMCAARARELSDEYITGFRQKVDVERGQLRLDLGGRRKADEEHEARLRDREAAARDLKATANEAGISPGDPGEQAGALEQWQQRHREKVSTYERRAGKWDRFQRLLGDESLEELRRRAGELSEKARVLSGGLDPETLAEARRRGITEERVAHMQSDLERRNQRHQKSLVEIEASLKALPNLAEAEEALAAATEEHDRVRQLDSILDRTIGFLKNAEERIHRDLAPVLQRGILEWLSRVTGGRYTDCRVNPETLQVEVAGRDRPWRSAADLSHGAAEQIYLLLRLALTRYLGNPEEPCPLILDDPLAASDGSRRELLLETLRSISERRQVILFTHEEEVRSWAEQRLTGPHDQLEQLEAGIPA